MKLKKNTSNDPWIILPRQHHIDRASIDQAALEVTDTLLKAGYETYLVGGGVRDLCMKHSPKDFDIATSARPQQIRKLFRRCYLIGHRFRLAHVYWHGHMVEVATFRAPQPKSWLISKKSHRRRAANCYGTLTQDARCRDFSINALYCDVRHFVLLDYVNGMQDLEQGIVRILGDNPRVRYREDPVRLLRAVRFAAKLNFSIEQHTESPLYRSSSLLLQESPHRLMIEWIKLLCTGHAEKSYRLMQKYDLIAVLSPQLMHYIDHNKHYEVFLLEAFRRMDQRYQAGKTLSTSFLLAVLWWGTFSERVKKNLQHGYSQEQSIQQAQEKVLSESAILPLAVTRSMVEAVIAIWRLQYKTSKQDLPVVVNHTRFRAAYDFLCLRRTWEPIDHRWIRAWQPFYEQQED